MLNSTATWLKKKNRLWEWNECSNCGHKILCTIWHDDVTYPQCPQCGFEMENYTVPEREIKSVISPNVKWNIDALPKIGKCLKYGQKANQKEERCLTCGWNETEYRRRLQCPWVLRNGLWHLDISRKEKK